jgi:predicted ATPase/DNA-binding SARP family transcriptional activator
MRVDVRLLGSFAVAVDGRPVPPDAWRRRSAAALVKLLALHPGHRLRREQVVDALWPDLLVEEAAPRLHQAAHYARSALGTPDGVVLAQGAVSLLPTADVHIDVEAFDRAAAEARADGGPEAAAAAADRYGGDLLPADLYEAWLEEPRARLRLRHLELLHAAGRFEELVTADPLDETAWLALVRDHLRHGRQQPALRALDRMGEVFLRELGTGPGAAADELRRQATAAPVAVLDRRAAGPAIPEPRRPVAPGTPGLPAPRNRLIGRRADLAAIDGLLRAHRVVTITGPGGAGKSRLSLAVARHRLSEARSAPAPDVVLAELAPVRDAAGVVRAVAEAAAVQGEGAVELSRLAATLGSRPVLLLLDNCEHLLDDAAALVDAVLDAGPRARVLATSREPLRVDGEAEHRIGSLGVEAAELFVERAVAAAGPDAATADDPRVVELCARLDGLPLAIELAAAQLRHLTLDELVDRLDERLTLLVGGRPRAGARHSALTATVEWSYQLLTPSAQQLLDALGVFPAGFDLAAAQAVAGDRDPASVTTLLGDLVAKSLVVHDAGHRRYSLLETIRLFAVTRLEAAGRREEMVERLRRHVVARTAALTRTGCWLSTTVAARSRDDLPNVRLAFEASLARGEYTDAVDVALSLSTLWRNAVSYAEGRRWVTELLAHDLPPRDRLWTHILETDVGMGSGDPQLMSTAAAAADELAGCDDETARALAAIYRSAVQLITPQRAAEGLARSRELARAAGEPGLERVARAFLVVARRLLGDTDGLDAEIRAIVDDRPGGGYDRYFAIWAAWVTALVDRDGPRMRQLMDWQLSEVAASGLRENWLTDFSDAMTMVAEGTDYRPQLRRARACAEREGRRAEADCVLAIAYAAACEDDWELAAELLAATGSALFRDTASFLHLALLRDQLVHPRLSPAAVTAASARGEGRQLAAVLDEYGI